MPPDLFIYRAAMLRVVDGDTVDLRVDLGFRTFRDDRFRLYGIDTPELNSSDPVERARAVAARDFLQASIAPAVGWTLFAKTHKDDRDKYGRWLVELLVMSPVGDIVNVNEGMITNGHAVRYIL